MFHFSITFNWQPNITQPTIQKFKYIGVCPFCGFVSSFHLNSPFDSPQLLWVFHSEQIALSWVWLVCDRFPAILLFWAQFPLIRCFFFLHPKISSHIFHIPFEFLFSILYIVMSNTNKTLSMVPCTYVRCIVDVIGGVAILVSRLYFFCCWSIRRWNGSVACDTLNDIHVCLCCFECFVYC